VRYARGARGMRAARSMRAVGKRWEKGGTVGDSHMQHCAAQKLACCAAACYCSTASFLFKVL